MLLVLNLQLVFFICSAIIASVLFVILFLIISKQKREILRKSNFIDFLVHELKTPITTIEVSSDLIAAANSTTDNPKLKKYIGIIKTENHRLKQIIGYLLDLSKIEKNKNQLAFEVLDLHSIVNDAADSLKIQVEKKDGSIHFNLEAMSTMVFANEFYLKNAIINVIENAIKYSNHPQIWIKTETNNNKIILKILDNGIGINRQNLNKIFKKYYQVRANNNQYFHGYGIGLYFVKTVVNMHSAKIKVISQPNVGTEVIFYLQLHYKMY